MAEAVERYYPGEFGLRVSDYMKDAGVTRLDRRHKDSWRRALRYPFLARAGQRLIDTFPRPAIAAQRRILRNFARAAAGDLNQEPSPARSLEPRPRNHRARRGQTSVRLTNARPYLRHRTPQHQRLLGRAPRRPHRRSLRGSPARPAPPRRAREKTRGRRLPGTTVLPRPTLKKRGPREPRPREPLYLPRRVRGRGRGRKPETPDRDPAELRRFAPSYRCNGL